MILFATFIVGTLVGFFGTVALLVHFYRSARRPVQSRPLPVDPREQSLEQLRRVDGLFARAFRWRAPEARQ